MKRILLLVEVMLCILMSPHSVQAVSIRVPILMYHYIGNNPNPADTARDSLSVPPDKFDAQLQYLQQQGFTPIDLNTLYGIYNGQIPAPPKPIVLTFDDGYEDFYYNAFPILQKYHFKAVSFIPTGLMNQGYYLTWDQIKEMQASGLIDFEDHGVSHISLSSLSPQGLAQELTNSKSILEDQTGRPVLFIAYPYGTSNGVVQAAAQKAGFVGGLGTWWGDATDPGMNLPRIRVGGQSSLATFAASVQ